MEHDRCGLRQLSLKKQIEGQVASFIFSQIEFWEKKLRSCDEGETKIPVPGSRYAFILDNLNAARTAWVNLGVLIEAEVQS